MASLPRSPRAPHDVERRSMCYRLYRRLTRIVSREALGQLTKVRTCSNVGRFPGQSRRDQSAAADSPSRLRQVTARPDRGFFVTASFFPRERSKHDRLTWPGFADRRSHFRGLSSSPQQYSIEVSRSRLAKSGKIASLISCCRRDARDFIIDLTRASRSHMRGR